MIKNRWILASLVCLVASNASAEGSQNFSLGFGFDQGFSVLLQSGDINLAVGDSGIAVDYLFKKGSFDGQNVPFTWYIGAGGWIGWDNHGDEFGARLPLGLDWNFADKWDAYGQLHPELNYNTHTDDFDLDLGAAIGVRYSF